MSMSTIKSEPNWKISLVHSTPPFVLRLSTPKYTKATQNHFTLVALEMFHINVHLFVKVLLIRMGLSSHCIIQN